MAETVVVNDVGPRDGLQNQPQTLGPQQRLQLIGAIRASGLDHIEVGSFVSPKVVPAMATTAHSSPICGATSWLATQV